MARVPGNYHAWQEGPAHGEACTRWWVSLGAGGPAVSNVRGKVLFQFPNQILRKQSGRRDINIHLSVSVWFVGFPNSCDELQSRVAMNEGAGLIVGMDLVFICLQPTHFPAPLTDPLPCLHLRTQIRTSCFIAWKSERWFELQAKKIAILEGKTAEMSQIQTLTSAVSCVPCLVHLEWVCLLTHDILFGRV